MNFRPINETDPSSSAHGDAHPSSPAAASSGTVIEVPYEKDLTEIVTLVVLIVLGTIVAVMMMIFLSNLGLLGANRRIIFLCIAIAFGLGILLFIFVFERSRRADIRVRLERSAARPIRERIEEILSTNRSMAPQRMMRELLLQIAKSEPWGTVIRIGRIETFDPLEPIPFAFEPRRIEDSSDLRAMKNDGCVDNNPHSSTSAPARGVRRNLMLKGGWILLGLFSFSWLASALKSILSRRIEFELLWWTLALFLFVMIPVDSNWRSQRQIFLVPGGVVVRKGGWFKRDWRLKLCPRAASCVMIYPLWKKQWAFVVSDGKECVSAVGLRSEMELALRAWLSPLEPPSVERLSDLG